MESSLFQMNEASTLTSIHRPLTTFLVAFTATVILTLVSSEASAYIHTAPIVIKGDSIKRAARYPIWMYRLYKTDKDGVAKQIPFQIDEINQWGDYVLDRGKVINKFSGNGVFDFQDELAFMGDDVGEVVVPKTFPENKKPSLVYEIKFDPPPALKNMKLNRGAVYLGVFFSEAPKINESTYYVVFDPEAGEVTSSRYKYKFNPKNYLVTRSVEMLDRKKSVKDVTSSEPLIDSSTFFMKADLKYFLTLKANHDSINSDLEAYKVGPIRSIVRVTFYYKFLKINFELGMYTEVSFFANSVILPAVMYSPVDGAKSLNRGSGFYYGFALHKNPKEYKIDTNMPAYKKDSGVLDFLFSPTMHDKYWVTITENPKGPSQGKFLYFEIQPSKKLNKLGNIPSLYREDVDGASIMARGGKNPMPLGESPVNLGMYFDLTKMTEGEHDIAFRLFFENAYDPQILESFKHLGDWRIELTRM